MTVSLEIPWNVETLVTLDPYSGGGGEEADVEVKGVCAFVSWWHRGQGSAGTGSSKSGRHLDGSRDREDREGRCWRGRKRKQLLPSLISTTATATLV